MTMASSDREKVLHALGIFENGLSARLIADAVGWRAPRSQRLDTARVHRALMLLAAEKLIWQDERRRWRIVKRKDDSRD